MSACGTKQQNSGQGDKMPALKELKPLDLVEKQRAREHRAHSAVQRNTEQNERSICADVYHLANSNTHPEVSDCLKKRVKTPV